jgi:hypothetical protein
MRSTRVLVAATMLVGAMLLAPARAYAAIPDCDAVDFQEACIIHVDLDFTDTVLCDFPVQVHVGGWVRYRPFFATDGSGNLASEEWHFHYLATIVNPATGRSFSDGSGNVNERVTHLADGTLEIRDTGIFHNAVTDDGQRLFHQSGNHSFVLGPDDELISEVFHGLWQSEEAFPGKVCPILAQPL